LVIERTKGLSPGFEINIKTPFCHIKQKGAIMIQNNFFGCYQQNIILSWQLIKAYL